MAKTLTGEQIKMTERRAVQPFYLVKIYNVGAGAETLYFSDRTFKIGAIDYEDYLTGLSELAQSIERDGGYRNISARLVFKNARFRTSAYLVDWFQTNPITRKEMELFVVYAEGFNPYYAGVDTSISLGRFGIGELRNITRTRFEAELSTVIHLLDQKNLLYRINETDWPNADPKVIGQAANIVYGYTRDTPCQCVKTGAYSTLRVNIGAAKITLPLSEVDYPIAFSAPGNVYIEDELIYYSAVDTATKTLTGCARGQGGTVAKEHKAGTPVLKKLSNYKWMAAGHVCKAIDAVKVDRVTIPATDYTVDLNDGGRTTITFSERMILKHQGGHAHPTSVMKTKYAIKTGASVAPTTTGINWQYIGQPSLGVDRDTSTRFKIRGTPYTGSLGAMERRHYYVTFSAYTGPKPAAVYLCVMHKTQLFGAICKADVKSPAAYPLDKSGVQKTERFKLAGVTIPPTVHFVLEMPAGSGIGDGISTEFYEVYLELELAETGSAAAGGVFGAMDDVFSPLVTADVEGYKDDDGGTYTGTPNALIQNPSDVRRHFLIAILGRAAGDLNTASFNAARTEYATLNYKTNTLLNRIGEVPSEILATLDRETRSLLKEDQGKWFLSLVENGVPGSLMSVTKDDIYGEVVFDQTPIDDVRNVIRTRYDVDWGGGNEKNHYIGNFYKFYQASNAASIAKYGELAEDIEFQTTKTGDQVTSVVVWILKQKKDVLKKVAFEGTHAFRKMERGDYFLMEWDFWGLNKYRIISIREIPGTQRFAIEAVEYSV